VPGIERLTLSVPEVARLLGISRTSAYRYARRIGVKIGRRVVVPRGKVEALLELERGAIDLTGVGR
jgi:predicted DNA-binding transcriptional regulator AlpA